jgi:hypothetical protein
VCKTTIATRDVTAQAVAASKIVLLDEWEEESESGEHGVFWVVEMSAGQT